MITRGTPALMACAMLLAAASCASKPAPRPNVRPELSPEVVLARLAEADALVSRGCYLCLLDASAIYEKLVQASSSLDAARTAIETDLMIAIRERELQIPDTGARARADALRPRFGVTYDPHFALLDAKVDVTQAGREAVRVPLEALGPRWATEPVAAYFYLTFAAQTGRWVRDEIRTEPQKIAAAHPGNASLQYRVGAFLPTYDANAAALSALLEREPRFAEIRLARAQRSLLNGGVVSARKELVVAHDILPQSLIVKSAFGAVEFAYVRYVPAVKLFDEVLVAGPNPNIQLLHAQAIGHLGHHREAIAEFDRLLADDPSTTPGDKYYWRAWNKLQLGELRPAYDDATTALKFMNGPDSYRLAGIATFFLEVLPEARDYFESALKMSEADCDSRQYIGQLDAAERKWASASAAFAKAGACFDDSISKLTKDLGAREAANTDGLLNEQIAGLRADIERRSKLRDQSFKNAEVTAKNTPPLRPVP